jgi:NAD(P)-dependent dehydrogenase (short-subunit alcohol dehydrogenase family)
MGARRHAHRGRRHRRRQSGGAGADLAAAGAEVLTVGVDVDVSDRSSVESLFRSALERFERISLVCNNAGVGGRVAYLTHQRPEDWAWVLGVNFFGVLHGVDLFLPHLLDHGEGHILNTASAAGFVADPTLGPYTVSKHAVVALSEVLYDELCLMKVSVGVSVLCPGMVSTRLAELGRNRPARFATGEEPIGPSRLEQAYAAWAERAVHEGLDPEAVAEARLSRRHSRQLLRLHRDRIR